MRTLLTVILASLLAACAAQQGIERSKGERLLARYEPYVGEPIKSFTAFRQESWQPISRTQFVLWTDFSHAYLITVSNNCPELQFADSISVTSTTSSISTLDHVLVRGDRCQIQQIQPIDVTKMRKDREAERKAAGS